MADYQVLKEKFLRMYGLVCGCCGEANPKFLTLDHRLNDGGEHREKLRGPQPARFAPRVTSMGLGTMGVMKEAISEYRPDIYQILCYNCNFGRAHNEGICPHKQESPDLKAYRKGKNR